MYTLIMFLGIAATAWYIWRSVWCCPYCGSFRMGRHPHIPDRWVCGKCGYQQGRNG